MVGLHILHPPFSPHCSLYIPIRRLRTQHSRAWCSSTTKHAPSLTLFIANASVTRCYARCVLAASVLYAARLSDTNPLGFLMTHPLDVEPKSMPRSVKNLPTCVVIWCYACAGVGVGDESLRI